ncbi:MAG: hypothetical protein CML17_03915 [Pusillimonas sp.]|nr:hypothetical protein [Pusillimonas sp.]|tara:strand:- start:273 stop:467 length:195 start_codon:yes stop_codon:yes gene_type:complete
MKDIKVIFKGNKHPSGKKNDTEYFISKNELNNFEMEGTFDIEILHKPKPKVKKKSNKAKKKKVE